MNGAPMSDANAWIAVDHVFDTDRRLAPYTLVLKGDRSLYQAIAVDDWVLVLNPAGRSPALGAYCGFAPASKPPRSSSTEFRSPTLRFRSSALR